MSYIRYVIFCSHTVGCIRILRLQNNGTHLKSIFFYKSKHTLRQNAYMTCSFILSHDSNATSFGLGVDTQFSIRECAYLICLFYELNESLYAFEVFVSA